MPGTALFEVGAAGPGRPEMALPARAAYAPRRHPHVCFVAPHAWPVLAGDSRIQVVGGAEVQQAVLARLFAANGYRVSMICLDYGQPARAEIDGVVAHRSFRMEAGVPVLRFLHPRLTSMWRAMRRVDADIYYYRSAAMLAGVMAQFCRRHGRRSIYAGASDEDFTPGAGGQIRYARDRWLYRRGLAMADRIVVQNEVQRETCLATHGRESVYIPSCYVPPRAARQDGAPSAEPLVLWVGAIHPNKRPEEFLRLAAALPQRRFAMIGGPRPGSQELFERIRAQAAALPNLSFAGFLPLAEVEPWFDRARLLVSTSLYEGMPNVFLQAWARGVPTVATVDVGAACNRVVASPDSLRAEVESLLDDPQLWRGASQRCRAHFERNHSSQGVLERYARLFDELMAGAAP